MFHIYLAADTTSPTAIVLMAAIAVGVLFFAWRALQRKSVELEAVQELQRCIAGKRYDEAIQMSKKIEGLYPLFAFLKHSRLSLMIANGQPADALKEVNEALEKTPKDRQYQMLQLSAYLGMGELDKAYETVERIQKKMPDPFFADLMMGIVEIERGEVDKGQDRIRKRLTTVVKQHTPRNPFLPKQKQQNKQAQAYEQIIKVAPFSDPMLNVYVGLAYYYIGEKEWALEIWQTISAHDKMGVAKAYAEEMMAHYYHLEQQYSLALDHVHNALFLLPKRGSCHYLVYQIHHKLGNPDAAEHALEQARRVQYKPAMDTTL